MKKELVFSSTMIAVGAAEANPILTGLTTSSLLLFSMVKLSVVVIAGLTFSKAVSVSESTTCSSNFTKGFLYGGYSLTVLTLLAIVSSNIFVLFRS